jgi:hypothetical protein
MGCLAPTLSVHREVFAHAGYQGPRVTNGTRIEVEIMRRKPYRIGFAFQLRQ